MIFCLLKTVTNRFINRLETNLIKKVIVEGDNFSSNLRRFIANKGSRLVSLDIKASQPYLLAGVFNLILNGKGKKGSRSN